MNKSTQTRRQLAVNAAVGSMKLEGLQPSEMNVARLQAYAEGKLTIEQVRSDSAKNLSAKNK